MLHKTHKIDLTFVKIFRSVATVCCCCSHCMNSCKTAFSVFSCHFPTHTYSQIENQEAKNVMTSETSENFHRENPYHFLIRQFHLGIYFDFPFNIYLLLCLPILGTVIIFLLPLKCQLSPNNL